MLLPAVSMDARPISTLEGLVTVGHPKQEEFQRAMQSQLGQRMQAQVMSLLDDGSFLVKIAGSTVQMSLPQGTRAGDMLPLTLVSLAPKATFLLELGGDTVETTLSTAGKMIANVLQLAQKTGADTAAASSVLNKSPIMQTPAADAPEIAAALRDTLRGSGIFYESHIADWADGKRSLTNLQQEPQARLAEQATRILAGDTDAPQKIAANAAELARLVSQQLDTLEHQRVTWRGEAWPGQPMEWDVEQRPDQNQGETDDGTQALPATWQSTVRFDMPSLGKVAVTVYLQEGQLRIHVSAASDNTRAALQAQREKLSASLDAAGSPLSAFLVKHDAAI